MKTISVTLILTLLNLKIMATELKTSITIQATPQEVWAVLTNFEEYPSWNPYIKSLTGNVKVGQKIKVDLGKMKFTPKVLVFEDNSEFKWSGHLLFPGVFDGKHRFQLLDNGDGTTTFIQSEEFKGILVPLFKKKLLTETKVDFEKMNLAIKQKVENR